MSEPLQVLGVGVWTPTQPSLESFLAERSQAPASRPETQLLGARTRGRASLLTLMFANVVEQASAAAGIERGDVPIIFASAYGEMGTTLSLLEQLNRDDGRLSPAKFQASVHNTAAGQISIADRNRSFSTALAAGHDTVAMALIEAWAFLAREPGSVIVACADEGAPGVLAPERRFAPLAAAWVLSNGSNRRPGVARLARLVATTRAYEPSPSPSPSFALENPCAAALSLARALFAAAPSSVVLNQAAADSWQIDVLPNPSSAQPTAAGVRA
jgi:hypothetical protein